MPISRPLDRARTLPLAVAMAAALALPAAAQDAPAPTAGHMLTVTGEGRVEVKPDVAFVSVGVTEQAPTADAALSAMSTSAQAVLARLRAAGIPDADIQTGQLSLDPRYDYSEAGQGRPDGFEATTMLDVKVGDIDMLGAVLDAVVKDGANRLGGVRFDLEDRGPALDEARRAAVADARARAALFADAAEVELGDLRSLSEAGSVSPPLPMMEARMAMDASAAPPVAGGQITLSASVTMTYDIDG